MIRSLKLLFVFILLVMCVGCRSTKNKRATVINQTETSEKALIINETTNTVTERYGDTLKGVTALPKLDKTPIWYSVSSGGITLDLELTDSSLRYQVTPKPIARTTTRIDKTTQENASKKVETVARDTNTTVVQPWQPPFWMYLVGIGLLIAAYYIFKNHLNPFKHLIK